MGTVRIITGGKFDWPFHKGHKKFLEALSDIPHNASLFIDPDDTRQLERFLPQIQGKTELWVALTRDEQISKRVDMRPVLPEQIRASEVAALPGVAGVFLSDGDLLDDAQAIGARAVGFSTTTKDFDGEGRRKIRDGIQALGMYGLVLPQMVDISTTKALEEFFDGKGQREFRIVNDEGLSFPLLYSDEMVLTPDLSSVEIARAINHQLRLENKSGARILEMGVGSGVFASSLILNSDNCQVGDVHVSDIDPTALAIADFNISRAMSFKGMDQDSLTVTKNDWFTDMHGERFDVVYVNPPFFTKNVIPPPEFEKNPSLALYPPNLTFHYEKIFSGLGEHMTEGGIAVVRIPKTEGKVNMIKKIVADNLNIQAVEMNDVTIEDGRFLILKFPQDKISSTEYADERTEIRNRIDLLSRIERPQIKDWFTMTDEEFSSLHDYCVSVQTTTTVGGNHHALDADTQFWEHLYMMDLMIRSLFRSESFRETIPSGMGLNYLRSLVLMHDFSRLAFNTKIQMRDQDIISEMLLAQLFPESKLMEHLHSIRWVTDEQEVDEAKPLPLILKALDTLGKRDRDPKTLHSSDGPYMRKFKKNMGSHPMDVPIIGPLSSGLRRMSIAEYTSKDIELTLKGARMIEDITGKDFMEFKREALS